MRHVLYMSFHCNDDDDDDDDDDDNDSNDNESDNSILSNHSTDQLDKLTTDPVKYFNIPLAGLLFEGLLSTQQNHLHIGVSTEKNCKINYEVFCCLFLF